MTNSGIDLSPQNVIKQLEWMIEKFESYDIKVNKSCRLYKFYVDYNKLIKSKGFSENIDELLEGMRDFFELWQIVKSDEVIKNSRNEMENLLGGRRMPSEDKNPLARNLQYQLFLASIFSRSNMNVRFEEPDFLFSYMGDTYSVAAKRITSKHKVNERIREAEKQILKYEYEGFIALSLDRLFTIENPCIILDNNEILNEATQELIYSLVRRNITKECFLERHKKIKGIVVTLGIPSFNPNDLSLGYGFNLKIFPLVDPIKNKVEFDRIGRITQSLEIMNN